VAAQLFLLMLILMLMLVIEEAGQILLPAKEAYESANDPTASLYGAASKPRMMKEGRNDLKSS
jgi:hypothetical protein